MRKFIFGNILFHNYKNLGHQINFLYCSLVNYPKFKLDILINVEMRRTKKECHKCLKFDYKHFLKRLELFTKFFLLLIE